MKTLKSAIIISLFCLSAGFYACTKNQENGVLNISQQDRDFVTKASQANMAEVKLGGLATQKSTNDSIVAFANKMVAAHTKSKRQLDSVVQVMTLVKVDTLNAAQDTAIARISRYNGFTFDTAYIGSQVRAHTAAQALLKDETSKGTDKGLKWYANKTLPDVNKHLQWATSIRAYLQGLPHK